MITVSQTMLSHQYVTHQAILWHKRHGQHDVRHRSLLWRSPSQLSLRPCPETCVKLTYYGGARQRATTAAVGVIGPVDTFIVARIANKGQSNWWHVSTGGYSVQER
jgi:hypothetical protein